MTERGTDLARVLAEAPCLRGKPECGLHEPRQRGIAGVKHPECALAALRDALASEEGDRYAEELGSEWVKVERVFLSTSAPGLRPSERQEPT